MILKTKTDTFTNSVNPDETARYEPSHQDVHCLTCRTDYLLKPLLATMDVSKFRDGNVHLGNSKVKD